MSRDAAIQIVLAIEKAMDPADQQTLLRAAMQKNPWVRGAQVADVLDIAYDADAFLSRTEAFWAEHGDLTRRNPRLALALSYALIAAGFLDRDNAWAIALAEKVVPG